MKILRLSTFLDFGGVETRLANVSHVKDQNEWVFVCMNKEGRAAQVIKANNKRVINLHSKPSIYSFKTFFRLYQLLKKERPNVIHTSGAEANFHGILAAKLVGIPTIIGEEIGSPNHSKKAQLIFSTIYKLADYVVGNSDNVLKVVHELDKVPYSKLVEIANPIIFKELPGKISRNEEEFRIVMISRLEPVKNIEGVINVLARLVEKGKKIKLTIAGSGTLENELKSKVKGLNLLNNVEFVGFITDPYPYLLNADLYILNSFTEGFSNSLIEAMYSKTTSLSTAVGASPEIIKDSQNGFLVPVGEDDILFQKIESIMTKTKEELQQIGISGHEMVVNNFSLEKHISELMKLYDSI